MKILMMLLMLIVASTAGARSPTPIDPGPGGSSGSYTPAMQPIVASFTAVQTTGAAPFTAYFSDVSSGATATTWAWDFGDGTTATVKNPVHTYTNSGAYTVTLVATAEYSSDEIVRYQYITVTGTPYVSSVTGTVGTGQSVTIAGVSFGAKATAAPLKFETFEGGTVGDLLGDSFWYLTGNVPSRPTPPVYSTTNSRSVYSPQTAKFAIFGPETERYLYSQNMSFASNKVFIDYWTWWDLPTLVTNQDYQIKTVRFSSGETNIYPGGFLDNFYHASSNNMETYFELRKDGVCADAGMRRRDGSDLVENAWNHVQMLVTINDYAMTDGTMEWWLNGSYMGKNTGIRLGCTNSPTVKKVFIGGYLDNRDTGQTMAATLYYDDVYIDNSHARVELGDNPVYANCTHREIQIPSAWTSSSITATINTGSFANGTAYLFVVDGTGRASSGKQVTIAN